MSERTASLISFSRPANSPGASAVPASSAMAPSAASSVAALRSALAGDRDGLGELRRWRRARRRRTRRRRSRATGVNVERRDRAVGGDHAGDELALQGDRLLDPHLAGLEPARRGRPRRPSGAVGVVLEALLGAAGLDHHDGDVAVVELTAGDDELERAGVALVVGRVRDPLAVGRVGDADGADRAVERDAADHQRRRGGVDRQHVVRVLLVGAEDGGDDLGLVAEALRGTTGAAGGR